MTYLATSRMTEATVGSVGTMSAEAVSVLFAVSYLSPTAGRMRWWRGAGIIGTPAAWMPRTTVPNTRGVSVASGAPLFLLGGYIATSTTG